MSIHVILETERLVFREFTTEDAPLIYELNLDPEITRYTGDPIRDLPHAQLVLEQAILPQYALNNYGRWAVHLKSGMDFIGWGGLKNRPEKQEIDLGSRLSGAGEDLLGQAYADMTGGSGRGGVVEMEKKLEEAKERRKRRDQAAREAARSQGSNRISEGFQGSAGLYVTSGAAMIGSQSLAIQRSMLRELQSLTRATDRVRDTIRDTAYTS